MRRLLITGGTGFIGTNFVRYWIRQHGGDFVVVLDALTYAANRENLEPVAMHPNVKFVRGNILDRGLVTTLVTEQRLDTIVHFAAESHVDRSIVAPMPSSKRTSSVPITCSRPHTLLGPNASTASPAVAFITFRQTRSAVRSVRRIPASQKALPMRFEAYFREFPDGE